MSSIVCVCCVQMTLTTVSFMISHFLFCPIRSRYTTSMMHIATLTNTPESTDEILIVDSFVVSDVEM